MKTHEKILIILFFVILFFGGLFIGFWIGGGFYNPGVRDYQEREQAYLDRIRDLESIGKQFRGQLESERSERESLRKIAESERQENSRLRAVIESLSNSEISVRNRLSENDKRLESVIKKIRWIKNYFEHTDRSDDR